MEDTIFNYIDSVLFNKKKLNNLNEGETQFNLYMFNRWCSMYSPHIAEIVNQTTNSKTESFALKQDQYNFCFYIFPKVKKTKINYIKKIKEKNDTLYDNLEGYSKSLELSKREIQSYIELYKDLFK